MTKSPAQAPPSLSALTLAAGGCLLVALVWAYWPVLDAVASRWAYDAQYSHGYLVPLFSLYLLWVRRGMLTRGTVRGSWWGAAVLLAGLALGWAGTLFYVPAAQDVSLIVCVAGAVAAGGGAAAARWAWPAVLFLGFMLPLPYGLQTALSGPLQTTATRMSTYLLVTCGVSAVAEGNVIVMAGDIRIGVVEACSGLGMLYTFLALAVAVVLVRGMGSRPDPVWVRVAVVLSTIPVAVAANVCRITATGLLHQASSHATARAVFHDLAGWLMMPLALSLFFAEIWVLRRLVRTYEVPAVASLLLAGRPPTRPAAPAGV